MKRWSQILYYGARIAYLESVHRRVLECAPHHHEVSVTCLELYRARTQFDEAWQRDDDLQARRAA